MTYFRMRLYQLKDFFSCLQEDNTIIEIHTEWKDGNLYYVVRVGK